MLASTQISPPTRLHSNTSFCLLSFFYLLETLELHLVARRLSPGGPSRGTPLWWNLQLQPPHSWDRRSLENPRCTSPSLLLLFPTIGRFLDIHKSTLIVQWTATLDRAYFKTHSDLRQRSTTVLPPSIPLHTHSRKNWGTNCATSKLWMPDTIKDLGLTRLLLSPHPSHSNPYNLPEYYYILYFTHVN